MASEEKIPPAGESVNEVTFIKWAVQDGAAVKEGDPIAEVETDKANADLFASSTGVIKFTNGVQPGTVLKIGATYATIDANGKPAPAPPAAKPAVHAGPAGTNTAASSSSASSASSTVAANVPVANVAAVAKASPVTPPPPQAPTKAGNVEDLSPAARRAAVEGNVNIAQVTGTGPGGRITKEDVVGTGSTNGIASSNASSSAAPPIDSQQGRQVAPTTQGGSSAGGIRRVPMSKIRKRIAETLVRAKNTTAMLTTFNEVDMSAIMKLRATYKESFEKKHGIGLGFMSFFVKACTIALKQYERVNGQLDGDDVLLFDHVHISVAVSTERGLTVPVLKHADEMSFAKIESEIKRVAIAARDGKLGIDELSGGTFTITNGGIFGSLNSTPIVNPPQSAILGMHAIVERPVAIAGKCEIRPMMNLALSYDHRIVDGKESVTFLVRVKQLLEDPTRLLLDV